MKWIHDQTRICQRLLNKFDDTVECVEYFEIGDPKNEPAVSVKPRIPQTVADRVMRHVVDLDNQPVLSTREVDNEWTDRVLSPKSRTQRAPPDLAPESQLS
jgi:hypothetical protein